ncbi:MAG: ABC transporter ATP-binding protein [Acidobacteria bacterium]|nr:MAG: ABC transporter ATP-binding protein [Acidobacteriota bacterium]
MKRFPDSGEEGPSMIRVRGLKYRYRGGFTLDVPNLHLRAGQVTALVGPNGSGKTTFLGLLAGLLRPDEGSVEIGGEPLESALRRRRVAAAFDFLPPQSNLPASIWIRTLSRLRAADPDQLARLDRIVHEDGMAPWLNRPLPRLSAGQRRQAALAMAVIGDWDILLLDEPFASLDAETAARWMRRIERFAAAGKTIVVSSHRLLELDRLGDWFLFLRQGRIRHESSKDDLAACDEIRVVLRCSEATALRILGPTAIREIRAVAPGVVSLIVDGRVAGGLAGVLNPLVREGLEVQRIEPRLTGLERTYHEVGRA